MDRATVDRCLEILPKHPSIAKLDITGGAPELNPHFDLELAGESGRTIFGCGGATAKE
jgi:hypothetical protein